MATYHRRPVTDRQPHAQNGGDCWCEPTLEDYGVAQDGQPARVYVHHPSLNLPVARRPVGDVA
jgi:hypothetical protein